MKILYFDTNIFIYLSDSTSPYNKISQLLVDYCQKHTIAIATSTETFQEIIHYSKNIKQLQQGIQTANISLELIDTILSIDRSVIEVYLEKANRYKNAKSRDLIHLASCLKYDVHTIVTYDKDFKKFKEIRTVSPEEIVQ